MMAWMVAAGKNKGSGGREERKEGKRKRGREGSDAFSLPRSTGCPELDIENVRMVKVLCVFLPIL